MQALVFKKPNPGQAKLLLCSDTGALGDSIMRIPMLQTLRLHAKNSHITLLIHNNDHPAVHSTLLQLRTIIEPLIDTVVFDLHFPTRQWHFLLSYCHNPFKRHEPLQTPFDTIIDLDSNVKKTLILRKIPHQNFISSALRFMLSTHKPSTNYQRPGAVVWRHQDLADIAMRCDPGQNRARNIQFKLPEAMGREAHIALPPGPCYVAIGPGAGKAHKCWPLCKYLQLAKRQIALKRVPVIFLGPSEQHWQTHLLKVLPEAIFPEDAMRAAGFEGPLAVIALAKCCQIGVTNDCGIAHLFAAAKLPIVSLFGATSVKKFTPLTAFKLVLQSRDWGTDKMHAIPVDAVLAAIELLLRKTHATLNLSSPSPTKARQAVPLPN